MCVQCGKWIHCRCAAMKNVITNCSGYFACSRCEGDSGKGVGLGETL